MRPSVGDAVRLHSGGEIGTVMATRAGSVRVQWLRSDAWYQVEEVMLVPRASAYAAGGEPGAC